MFVYVAYIVRTPFLLRIKNTCESAEAVTKLIDSKWTKNYLIFTLPVTDRLFIWQRVVKDTHYFIIVCDISFIEHFI